MTLTIWGLPAGGGPYAAIAALTNIPATLLAVCFYELLLADSSRGTYHLLRTILRPPLLSSRTDENSPVITPAHADALSAHLAHEEHSQGVITRDSRNSSYNEKGNEEVIERV